MRGGGGLEQVILYLYEHEEKRGGEQGVDVQTESQYDNHTKILERTESET